jgi:type II secretory pathway component PulF
VAEFFSAMPIRVAKCTNPLAEAPSEREARERMAQQGFLVYSVRAKDLGTRLGADAGRKQSVNLEKFLIFNQQFVTLVRAGLPILKCLDLLADRLTDEKLGRSHQRRARRSQNRHDSVGCFLAKQSISRHLRHIRVGR